MSSDRSITTWHDQVVGGEVLLEGRPPSGGQTISPTWQHNRSG